jgi:phosphate transport system protein
MTLHIHREIDRLKEKILSLGAIVENNVHQAVKAINKQNRDLANKIIEADEEVNLMEIDIEEECLKILALHQPVAIDLRFIVAVLKINNDLERIGDLAVNIAERVFKFENHSNLNIPFDYEGMTLKVQAMLKKSLDSLVKLDTNLAREVCSADDEVDAIKSDAFKKAVAEMKLDNNYVQDFTQMLVVAQQLERIADHATNIAEDVIYMVEGKIVRHRLES